MHRRAVLLGLLVLAVATAIVVVVLLRRDPPRPHVILITLDTFRRDHLHLEASGTPRLARLARDGVRFEAAQAACPLTLPSHASMLTGLYPCRHGLRDNLGHALPERTGRGFATLTEILGDAGYGTAAFVSAATLDSELGLSAGFEIYDDPERDPARIAVHVAERRAGATNEAVFSWLESRDDDRPLFLWVHYFDPHAPYAAPYPFDGGATDAEKYAGEIAYADRETGALLDALEHRGFLENAIVAVLGDHGEGLGEHRERTHGHLLHEATLAIPFLLAGPGVPAGAVERSTVRTTDLLPTILGLVGLPVPGGLDGRDLGPLWRGESAEPPGPSYAESLYSYRECGWAQQSALTIGRLKLVDTGPRRELFDLASDPGEIRDLAAEEPERVAAMLAVLRRIRETPPPASHRPAADLLPAGPYGVAANTGRTTSFLPSKANAALPAPVDRMDVVAALDRARTLFSAGAYLDALTILDALAPRESMNPSVAFWRAYTLRKAERHAEAADEAMRAMDLGLRSAAVRDLALNSLVLAGRHDQADVLWQGTRDRLAPTPRSRLAMASSLMTRGRHAEALAQIEAVMKDAAPDSADRERCAMALRALLDPEVGAPGPIRDRARTLLDGNEGIR